MRVAALADVHGNAMALDAVLAELEREQPDLIVSCGDLTWGALPRETVALLEPWRDRMLLSAATPSGSSLERRLLDSESPAGSTRSTTTPELQAYVDRTRAERRPSRSTASVRRSSATARRAATRSA